MLEESLCRPIGFLTLILVATVAWGVTAEIKQPASVQRFNPVLFIPGDGGSQLQARLNKTDRVHYLCDLQSDWFDIWLNLHLLVPGQPFECFSDNMRLVYNATTRTTQNSPGVEIRATDFGSIESVANLDIWHAPGTSYFETIVKTLESRAGLVRDVNMFGAAWDFRKAPNELDELYQNITNLIEHQFVQHGRPLTLICHSLGCLNTVHILQNKTQSWKDTFVKRLITLGAPWDGSLKAVSAMLYGDDLGIWVLPSEQLRKLQSSFPSLMYLFPREPSFEPNRTLISTPSSNYTVSNLQTLFEAANLTVQREMWLDTKSLAAGLRAPNVEIWCLYGTVEGKTPKKIVYTGSDWRKHYYEINGEGDGTVNLESLRACERFAHQQDKPVYTREFVDRDHLDIIRHPDIANFIVEHILIDDVAEAPQEFD